MPTDKGIVFDIERTAIHDGPGVRTTIFLKGCPLRCRWCHNPEGLSQEPQLSFEETRCLRCGRCVSVCPQHAFSMTNRGLKLDRGRCISCFQCTEVCPSGTLSRIGREMTVEDVWMETSKDMDFYQVSGGGVTFSGGEPLVQLSFLRALVEKHRQEGIHTAIETSLYCDFAAIDSLLGFVDLFIFDLKIIDEQKHIEYTGVSSASILANAEKLFQAGCPTIVRIPLVPGITDTEENISAMVRFLEKNNRNGILYVSLLPYHCFGDGKCNALGGRREFRPPHANPAIKDAVKHFQRLGIETKVGY